MIILKDYTDRLMEKLDAAMSFIIGFFGILLSTVIEKAPEITVIGGIVIITLRVIYEFVKLKRLLQSKKDSDT